MMKKVAANILRLRTTPRSLARSTYAPCAFQSTKSKSGSSNSLVLRDKQASLTNPWQAVQDPKGSQLTYYWNPQTNQTTPLGFPKPQHWVEVEDPNGSELTYWWNPETNQTTALGAPKPPDLPPTLNVNSRGPMYAPQVTTFGGAMKTYFIWGVGMTLAFGVVRAILG